MSRESHFTPGDHSELIRAIVEDFGPRYAPAGQLVYVGDTGNKHRYYDIALLKKLGIDLDGHGKFPDVVIYHPKNNWLLLIESPLLVLPLYPCVLGELCG